MRTISITGNVIFSFFRSLGFLCFLLCFVLGSVVFAEKQAKTLAPSTSTKAAIARSQQPRGFALRLPFALLQQLSGLQEGKPIPAWEGRANLWPQQKESFLQSEKAELALGRSIRANPKQQQLEAALTPSMKAEQGFIHMRFGWRLHKQVPLFSDYADGTLDCDAYLKLLEGQPQIKVQHTRLHYNANAVEAFLGGPFIALFEQLAAKVVEQELEKGIDKALKDTTRFLPYKHLFSLAVEPDTLVLYLGK